MSKHDTGSEHHAEANPDNQIGKSDEAHLSPTARAAETFASRPEDGSLSDRARQMMNDMATATGHMASGLVNSMTSVATDLVQGVGDIGSKVVSVVKDTANSAIEGVGSIGETAVHTLTGLLVGLVGGVRDIGSAAMRSGRSGAMGVDTYRTEIYHEKNTSNHDDRNALYWRLFESSSTTCAKSTFRANSRQSTCCRQLKFRSGGYPDGYGGLRMERQKVHIKQTCV